MRMPKAWILPVFSTMLIVQGCGRQSENPVIAEENAENVQLVLYLSDGDSDWKSVGEIILIDSGELLHVKRNQIRPDEQLITKDWNNVFQPEFKKAVHIGILPLRLDRKNGIVCNASRCTTLYSICPSWKEMHLNEVKCVSFPRD